jgi:hypothetical protein
MHPAASPHAACIGPPADGVPLCGAAYAAALKRLALVLGSTDPRLLTVGVARCDALTVRSGTPAHLGAAFGAFAVGVRADDATAVAQRAKADSAGLGVAAVTMRAGDARTPMRGAEPLLEARRGRSAASDVGSVRISPAGNRARLSGRVRHGDQQPEHRHARQSHARPTGHHRTSSLALRRATGVPAVQRTWPRLVSSLGARPEAPDAQPLCVPLHGCAFGDSRRQTESATRAAPSCYVLDGTGGPIR